MPLKIWEDPNKKILNKNLYADDAEEWAKTVYDEHKNSEKKHNKPAQIRKFYDELLSYKERIRAGSQSFEEALPFILMLKAKSAYSKGRDLIGAEFKTMIDDGIKQSSQNKETFSAFVNFFEAFLGYYKFYEKTGGDS